MYCCIIIRHSKAVKTGVSHPDKKLVGSPRWVVFDKQMVRSSSWAGQPFTVHHDAAWPKDPIELSQRLLQLCLTRKVTNQFVRNYYVNAPFVHLRKSSNIRFYNRDALFQSSSA